MERAITFTCQNNELLGILHEVDMPLDTAVLIVVGGPQYRVGSHRQFVQMSRALAKSGVNSLRFDYRGMGDSMGVKQDFENISHDIEMAVDALIESNKNITQVVIWGLCDAASAAMIYAHNDIRIRALVMLNPWLRDTQSTGKTMVKHYYLQRLLSADFWRKLFSGNVNVCSSIGEAKGFVKDSMAENNTDTGSYQSQMEQGANAFSGPICLILSGVDLTAKEFEQKAMDQEKWQSMFRKNTSIHRIAAADHTFSSSQYKRQVEAITCEFVCSLSNRKLYQI